MLNEVNMPPDIELGLSAILYNVLKCLIIT